MCNILPSDQVSTYIIIIHCCVQYIYIYYMFYVLVVVMTCVKALGYSAPFIIISGFWHTCIWFDNLYQLNTCLLYIPTYLLRISNIGNESETTFDRHTIALGRNISGGRCFGQFVSFELHELISYFAMDR